jgi:2-oxoglutarate ferredoxin oxidoreductase subunit beta
MENPVNPLLYVLGYGAEFVAQGTPADMNGLATIVEQGIRYPGFAFINVQSPCVTYGQEDQLLKAQKSTMQSLVSLKHDPANRLAAMDLAQAYGEKLYTGVFYRQSNPGPTFEGLARERHNALCASVKSRADVLNVFRLAKP